MDECGYKRRRFISYDNATVNQCVRIAYELVRKRGLNFLNSILGYGRYFRDNGDTRMSTGSTSSTTARIPGQEQMSAKRVRHSRYSTINANKWVMSAYRLSLIAPIYGARGRAEEVV